MKKKITTSILIALMGIVFLIDKVNAKEFNTTEQYRIYKCDAGNDYENCNFTSWTNVGTTTSNSINSTVIRGFSMNFAQNETLNAGGHYRTYIAFDTTPQLANAQTLQNYNCFGVNSNSTSGGLDENIESCELQTIIPTSNGITYIFDVVPAINIKSIKINIYLNTGAGYTSVKGLAKSNLSNDTSTSDAINNMSDDIINNQNQNTQDIINNQNELLTSECSNLLNPTLKTNSSHRGITYSPILNTDGIVKEYNVNGTRTSASNSYVTIATMSIEKGTKLKVYTTNNRVGIQLWDLSNNEGIGKTSGVYYDTYTFTQSYSNVEIAIWTDEETVNNAYIKAMLTKSDNLNYCVYGSKISKIDETNEILNQDHTYNNNPSQSTTNEKNQMNSFEQEEDALRNSLNLNIEDSEITINTVASNFIWNTINRLRAMSGKIVLLFTSVLSLGIMKMILGR